MKRRAHARVLLASLVTWLSLGATVASQVEAPGLEGSEARRQAASEEAAAQAQSVLHVGEPNGLTSDDAARLAAETSPRLDAAHALTAAAHAVANNALVSMIPDVRGSAVVTRLGRIGHNAPLEPQVPAPAAVENAISQTADPNARFALQAMYDQIQTSATTPTPVPATRYSLNAMTTYPVLQSLIAGLPAYRAAGKLQQATRIREETELQLVMLEAREMYYEYGRALAAVRIAEQQIEASRSNVETVRSQARSGAATPADVAILEAQLAANEVDLARAAGDRDRIAIALAAFLTRGDIGDFRASFGEDLSSPVPGPDGDYDQLLQEAVVHRTELAMLREQVSAARDQVRASGRLRLPELAIQLSGTYANPNLIYFPWEPVWRGNWLAAAELSWSLQSFMRAQAGLQRSNAVLAEVVAEHEQMLDSVRTEVAAARANLVASQQAYDASLEGVRAAAETFRSKQVQLQVGTAISNELTQVQMWLTRAQIDLVNSAIDLRIARVRLDRALGRYVDPRPGPRARGRGPWAPDEGLVP